MSTPLARLKAMRSSLARPEALGVVDAAVLIGSALVLGYIVLPAHFSGIEMDPEFTGWCAPIANRMAAGLKLYGPGGHSPMAPLPFLLVRAASMGGEATWLLESSLNYSCQYLTLFLMYLSLSRLMPRPVPALATFAAGAVFFAMQKQILYDSLVQVSVACLAFAAQLQREKHSGTFQYAKEWRSLALMGTAMAACFLSKSSTAVGASMGAVVALLATDSRPTDLVRRTVAFMALTGAAFAAMVVLMSPWVSPSGLFTDVFLHGSEAKGGMHQILDKTFSYVLSGLRSCVAGVVPMLVFYAMTRRGRAQPAPGAGAATTLSPAPVTFAYWGVSLAAIWVALKAWPALLDWGPISRLPFTSRIVRIEHLSDALYPEGLPSWINLAILSGGWLILALLGLRPFFGHRSEKTGRAAGLSVLAAVLIPASISHSFSVSVYRWSYDNNPLVCVAMAVAISAVVEWRPAGWRRWAGDAASVAMLFLVTVSSWHRFEPLWRYVERCTEFWPEIRFLAGARMRPDSSGLRDLTTIVRDLAPDARRDAVLMLPEDPGVEAWFERPRPRMSSAILFPDQYRVKFSIADFNLLNRHPPSVLVTGPEEVWTALLGQSWPGSRAYWAWGVPMLLNRVRTELLPIQYTKFQAVPIAFRGGVAHMTVWKRTERLPPAMAVDDPCHGARRALSLYWDTPGFDSFTLSSLESLDHAAQRAYVGQRLEGEICDQPQDDTVPLKQYRSEAAGDYVLTATEDAEIQALRAGYTFQRVEGYAFPAWRPGLVPLKTFYNPVTHDMLVTASGLEEDTALDRGYGFLRIEAFILPAFEGADPGSHLRPGEVPEPCQPAPVVPPQAIVPYSAVHPRKGACSPDQIGEFTAACPNGTPETCSRFLATTSKECSSCIQPTDAGGRYTNDGATLNDSAGRPTPNLPGCLEIVDGDPDCAEIVSDSTQCASVACGTPECGIPEARVTSFDRCLAHARSGVCAPLQSRIATEVCFLDFARHEVEQFCGSPAAITNVICGSGAP